MLDSTIAMRWSARHLRAKVAEAFVPAELRDGMDAERRALIVLAIVGVIVPVGLVRAVTFLINGPRAQGVVAAAATCAVACVPYGLRRTKNLWLTGNLVTLVLFMAAVRAAYARGGLGTPPLIAVGALPLVATFIAGKRSGVAWTIAVIAATIGFAVVRRAGHVIPDTMQPDPFWLELNGAILFAVV